MIGELAIGQSVQIKTASDQILDGVVDFIDGENGYASVCVSRGAHRSQDVKVVIKNSDHYKVINNEIK